MDDHGQFASVFHRTLDVHCAPWQCLQETRNTAFLRTSSLLCRRCRLRGCYWLQVVFRETENNLLSKKLWCWRIRPRFFALQAFPVWFCLKHKHLTVDDLVADTQSTRSFSHWRWNHKTNVNCDVITVMTIVPYNCSMPLALLCRVFCCRWKQQCDAIEATTYIPCQDSVLCNSDGVFSSL